jgi:hypothetical protein
MPDIDLEQVFGSDCKRTRDKQLCNSIVYLCNLPFANVIDPFRNTKFTGTQVVSLGKKDLQVIKGVKREHIPYNKEEIFAWMAVKKQLIPPLHFDSNYTRPENLQPRQKKGNFNTLMLDFKSLDSLEFNVHDILYITTTDIIFTNNDNIPFCVQNIIY